MATNVWKLKIKAQRGILEVTMFKATSKLCVMGQEWIEAGLLLKDCRAQYRCLVGMKLYYTAFRMMYRGE